MTGDPWQIVVLSWRDTALRGSHFRPLTNALYHKTPSPSCAMQDRDDAENAFFDNGYDKSEHIDHAYY